MSAARPRATAADLLVLAAALKRDEQRPAAEVRARDARIAAELREMPHDRTALTLAWFRCIVREEPTFHEWHERATGALQSGGLLIGLLGLVLGWLAALGSFYYEGAGRVNVIAVLFVLVGVSLLFLLVFFAAVLPRRWLAWVPGATAVSALARGISPGRIAQSGMRFLPIEMRDVLSALRACSGEHQQLYARVQKWLLLRGSQVFAVAFQCGAVSGALGLVLFTDLVFGWSTTLASDDPARDAARVHAVTEVIAAPWSWTLGEATPSLELIASSRYYRAVSETVSADRASRLGGWWSFLVLAMIVYGLLPRLIVLGVASSRLASAVGRAIAVTPGVSALARRLEAARVQTTASGSAEAGEETSVAGRASIAAERPAAPVPGSAAVVNWSQVPVDDGFMQHALHAAQLFHAGGASTLAADAAVVAQVADTAREGDGGVAILVKAWEPPLLEFVDFVQALRQALGDGVTISVFPVAPEGVQIPRAGTRAHLEVWTRRLARVPDPWLRVVAWQGEVQP